MRRELAENLLSAIMGWDEIDKASERSRLELFAAYKYDQYQQFAPGRRFIESLALWLKQFGNKREREIAYEFVKERLIFISNEEITSLVDLAFPTIIRPILLEDIARDLDGTSDFRVKKLTCSKEYGVLLRQMLVLGLSDGARTDWFRRLNPRTISHEQVFHAFDISAQKAEEMTVSLRNDLSELLDRKPSEEESSFKNVVLLDDFSASGLSYMRYDVESQKWKGKIPKVIQQLEDPDGLGRCIASDNVRILVVLYIAAAQAVQHLKTSIQELKFSKGFIELHIVFTLGESSKLSLSADHDFYKLLQKDEYFDERANNKHVGVGGDSCRFGFADCHLPLVLSHNTPNNSIYILWAEEEHGVEGLFPRVSRHKQFE